MSAVRSAEPLLASALVTDGELGEVYGGVVKGVTSATVKHRGAVNTGSGSVDGALGGGLEGGKVVGVWGEVGGGGGEVSVCVSVCVWW